MSLLAEENTFAQVDCSSKLTQAERLYTDGVIESVPVLLKMCMLSGFSSEEKIKAYKLLILCRIFEDDKVAAEKLMLEFLKDFPSYELTSSDTYEFIELYKSFRTRPIFSLSVFVGGNSVNPYTKEVFEVNNINASNGMYSSDGLGFQIGMIYSREITEYLDWSTGFSYQTNSFKYSVDPSPYWSVKLAEQQTNFIVPLFLRAWIKVKKYTPYLKAGVYAGYLNSSTGATSRLYANNSGVDIKGSDIDLKSNRNRFKFGAEAGIGCFYKIKRGNLFFELTYRWSFLNDNYEKNRYSDKELIFKYHYLDHTFRLNSFYFNVGLIYPFFKPIKLY